MNVRRDLSLSLALFAGLALSGCDSERMGTRKPNGTGGDGGVYNEGQGTACAKMDLLFIIDNSGSMEEEQGNLTSNFPLFMNLLNDFTTADGAQLDYRIGITTTARTVTYSMEGPPPLGVIGPVTDTGDDGRLLYRPECGMTAPWINRTDADPKSAFACVAQVGINGSGLEMPLEAMKLALVDRVADSGNQNFRRPDSLLAVVILTDENDSSRDDNNFLMPFDGSCPDCKPVASYAETLDTVTGSRGRWASAVIAGPGPGSCSSSFGDAAEATRLKDFVSLGGDQAVFSSICAGDLTQALETALGKFTAACNNFEVL